MLRITFVSLAAIVLAVPCLAQNAVTLPEVVITGSAPKPGTHQRCVDVEIGGSRAYNCLNEKFKQQVNRINPSQNIPPIDARSVDIRVGVVNTPAVQQQYGRNYGLSVVPFRPAPPVFTSPVGRR